MDTTSSLYVCLLLFTSWVDPSHQIIVFAKQGSTAILPCKLSDLSNQTLTVSWRTIKNKVFERTNNQTYQGKAYKGRVNIPEDELIKGSCSLVLKQVKLSDSARYYSYLMKTDRNDPINTVQLSVEAEETPEKRRNEREATLNEIRVQFPYPMILIIFPLSWIILYLTLRKNTGLQYAFKPKGFCKGREL